MDQAEELAARAKEGCRESAGALALVLWQEYGTYLCMKYDWAMSEGEIQSEFWMGVMKALPKDNGKGAFHKFLAWKGRWAVVDAVDRDSRRHWSGACSCGSKAIVYRAGRYHCRSCGSKHIRIQQREHSEEALVEDGSFFDLLPDERSARTWDRIVLGEKIERIRALLNGRLLALFDAIVIEGWDRESCSNYLAEIAERWDVSPQAVNVYLRRLRDRIEHIVREDL